MYAFDALDRQPYSMFGIALRQPFVSIAQPKHLEALVNPFNGGGADDPVNSGSRSSADKDCQFAFGGSICHTNIIPVSFLLVVVPFRSAANDRAGARARN